MKKIVLLIVLICSFPTILFAKAYFAGKNEMIERAECIAIVEISQTEKIDKMGNHWTYHQKAKGTVETLLKGNVSGDIEIYGMENFICAQCKFTKGRFLLFMNKDNNFWIGSNWHVGICCIKDGNIDWFKDDTSPFETERQPLKEVILDIQNTLKEK